MKAVILAGGFGTRLRPLTLDFPKPLIPIAGKPMVEYILETLPDEVSEVILATNYRDEQIRSYFDQRSADDDLTFQVVREDEPLGTGGALGNVKEYIDSTTIVFNGDVISSVDLLSQLDHHRKLDLAATLAVWAVEDPSRFGIVDLVEGTIRRFAEKPAPEMAFSNLINAGTYILEPEIFEMIGPGFVSIEREIFPQLTDGRLGGVQFHGYFVDAGTLGSYLDAQRTVVEAGRPGAGTARSPNVFAASSVHIGDGAELSECALLADSSLENDVVIRKSIIGPEVRVGEGAQVNGAIVQAGIVIEPGQVVEGNLARADAD